MNTTRITLVACTSFAAACSQAPTPDGTPQALVESALIPTFTIRGEPVARPSLAARMAELDVPGVSIAVLVDGEIAWAEGYGLADVESGRAVTPNTLFQAASISKPVAALAALRLVESGRVALDGDVNAYLTSWQVPENGFTEEAPVILRGILTHRAGLTVWGFPGYGPDEAVPDGPGVLDGVGNTDPVRVYKAPDESWRYSGGGYTVMQQLVADVHGKPFAAVMREEVLDPIGMVRSTYEQPIPAERQGDIATGYRPNGERVPGGWHTYPEQAAAGLWTTPSELALYAREIQRAWKGESTRVLGEALAREMLTPDADDWGLGPAISEDGERFRHGGSNQGFRSTFAAYIDGDDGVFVMTNSDSGSQLAAEIATTLAHAYRWSGPLSEEKVPVEVAAEVRERYVGTYVAPELGAELRFEPDGRGLTLRQGPGRTVLWPLSDSSFFDPDSGREAHFSDDGDEMTVRVGNIVAIRR
ncbi:serine hydrolase domain-containing protein [Candidatus Palauibacter sp.]|uniref:serine hydrolase domain-containing protein n=1 Tax=Candidatus Palauibacter sp. TaxID=3101350 RepID=UPI003B5C9F3B